MIIPLAKGALPLAELGRILRAEIPNVCRECIPERLVTDSREIRYGDLFCALIGNRDGHSYAEEAAKRGAVAILAERATSASAPHIIVPSTRRALADWAIATATGEKPLRIGITGSVGKTTVKDAVAAMLSVRYSVHASRGNYNNDLGLPFTLLEAPRDSEVIVCELGVNHPGEMALLSEILRPHISVITCIGHAHIGAFGSREGIASEKREVLCHAEKNGVFYAPITEPLLFLLPPNGIRREGVAPFDAHTCKKYGIPFLEEDIPRNLAYAFGASIGKACGLTEEELGEGLRRISLLSTRRKESFCKGIRFLDDSYNASPESMMSSLLYLSKSKKGQRIAVLGDMLELGEKSAAFHHAMGRFAAAHADLLFFFGAFASAYALGAVAGGAHPFASDGKNSPTYVLLADDKRQAANQIAAHLKMGDTVLFKASRALKAEELIVCLKEALL